MSTKMRLNLIRIQSNAPRLIKIVGSIKCLRLESAPQPAPPAGISISRARVSRRARFSLSSRARKSIASPCVPRADRLSTAALARRRAASRPAQPVMDLSSTRRARRNQGLSSNAWFASFCSTAAGSTSSSILAAKNVCLPARTISL